jgi:hypothetical protein
VVPTTCHVATLPPPTVQEHMLSLKNHGAASESATRFMKPERKSPLQVLLDTAPSNTAMQHKAKSGVSDSHSKLVDVEATPDGRKNTLHSEDLLEPPTANPSHETSDSRTTTPESNVPSLTTGISDDDDDDDDEDSDDPDTRHSHGLLSHGGTPSRRTSIMQQVWDRFWQQVPSGSRGHYEQPRSSTRNLPLAPGPSSRPGTKRQHESVQDDEDGSARPLVRKSRRLNVNDERKKLACLYHKFNPGLHEGCSDTRYNGINHVMAHLKEKHRPTEHHCTYCWLSFEDVGSLVIHHSGSACRPTGGVSVNALEHVSRSHSETAATKWYSIWDQLFPGPPGHPIPRPKSPYWNGRTFELQEQFFQFMRRELISRLDANEVDGAMRDARIEWETNGPPPLPLLQPRDCSGPRDPVSPSTPSSSAGATMESAMQSTEATAIRASPSSSRIELSFGQPGDLQDYVDQVSYVDAYNFEQVYICEDTFPLPPTAPMQPSSPELEHEPEPGSSQEREKLNEETDEDYFTLGLDDLDPTVRILYRQPSL